MGTVRDVRETTAIDRLAEDYTRSLVERSPLLATALGVPGTDHLLDDLSPAGHAAQAQLDRATLAALDDIEPVDETDRVTAAGRGAPRGRARGRVGGLGRSA